MTIARAGIRRALAALFLVSLPIAAAAQKPQPVVGGRWVNVPAAAPLGRRIDLTLQIMAAADAPHIELEFIPTAGVKLLSGRTWTGSISKGQILNRPATIEVVAVGTWTLGASITNRRAADTQVSGAVLTIRAKRHAATADAGNARQRAESGKSPQRRRPTPW
jgi:hypothetical protein